MAIRVLADYWKNYEKYEKVIKKCFYSLIRHFPTDDNKDAAFNQVLVEFHRRDIFNRFDPSRVNLTNYTLEKKFEQYLYTWVYQVLSSIYKSRGNQMKRFIPHGTMQDYHPQTNRPSKKTDTNETYGNRGYVNSEISEDTRAYPWYDQTEGFFVSEKTNVEEDVFSSELIQLIRKSLPESRRIIFDLMLKDYDPQAIAELLGCSAVLVYQAIREYREKAKKLLIKEGTKTTTL